MQGTLAIGVEIGEGRLRPVLDRPRAFPVAGAVLGRRAEDAAETLPRLFNLCRTAQTAAARLALGLEALVGGDLVAEILRDHLAKLFVFWPRALGIEGTSMPSAQSGDQAGLRRALFGPAMALPGADGIERWLAAGTGLAPILAAVRDAFGPGHAVAELPCVDRQTALYAGPLENSVASRNVGHPAVTFAEDRYGRGPLWRAMAVLADAEACLDGCLPVPERLDDGTALAPASRGLYALRANLAGGCVIALSRRTPTDHLVAPGGVLERSIASLPPTHSDRLGLLVAILDPCVPWSLREAADA